MHLICQQIWKTQQWPLDYKRSVFIPVPKKGNVKGCSNYRTIALISQASKGFPDSSVGKESDCSAGYPWFDSWVGKIHWRRDRLPSPVLLGFPCGSACDSAGKESICNAGDLSSIPGLGRSPGKGKGYPLQYSGLENTMDCIVLWVAKSQTRLSDFHFTSHASKIMLKILQAKLQQCLDQELPDFQAGFRKDRRARDQIVIIKKAREFQKNIYFCFIDYFKVFDSVDHNKLWKMFKQMGTPEHLTYILRNLCVGQEATVRARHGTMDLFQIGKGVRQGCILSPCLFNFYAEYIM